MTIYDQITAQIINQLEQGTLPWTKPWSTTATSTTLPIRHNGIPYQGVNILILWAAQMERNFGSNRWLTFAQALAEDNPVRKGEKGTTIVFSSSVSVETDDNKTKTIPFLKTYSVFNEDQLTNQKEKEKVDSPPSSPSQPPHNLFAALAPLTDLRHGGDRAFYSPTYDFIQMPHQADFNTPDGYSATLAHEYVHWTKHSSRLDRDLKDYAKEELVAEIGSAFLCAHLGISNPTSIRPDHAQYIAAWLTRLNNDHRLIFHAASKAQKAVEYLLNLGAPHA